jgi:hypothetical protein
MILETKGSQDDIEELILNTRDCLVDLSLNYSSVGFLDHSSFFQLTGNLNEEIENYFPTAGQISLYQESEQVKPILNHPFLLFKENFLTEAQAYLERSKQMKVALENLSPFFT